ncbi:MAG TPA: precorrin-3B synthase, partial [Pseudorhizobium sp.]|nr:precorrin-3B synthase [Pseudorhizobium sp.]
LDGSFKLHITGCPKGCAHPQPSPLALCGTAAGLSFISGRTADSPFHTITRHEIETALRQLAAFIRREKRDEETSAACLSRLGSDALAANLTSGHP